jgi:hypothetical protein
MFFAASLRTGRNAVLRHAGRSDVARWSASENLEQWWEERTIRISRLIPRNVTVLEFGAGRRALERHLDPSCRYIPSDLVDRGPGTVICDLNRRPLPDLHSLGAQCAVFAGVFEYLTDVDAVAQWLGGLVLYCVVSYEPYRRPRRWGRRIRQKLRRVHFGYMNHHTDREFMAMFARAGFVCVMRTTWCRQRIYLLVKSQSRANATSA